MSLLTKPIRTRSLLPTPGAIQDRRAVEAWVIRWTRKRVRIDDPDFKFIGPWQNQKERESIFRFAKALQRELLHFENWDGTPRS